jgi:hypothetical protein
MAQDCLHRAMPEILVGQVQLVMSAETSLFKAAHKL